MLEYNNEGLIIKANEILKELKKRITAIEVLNVEQSFVSSIFFKLSNHKHMIIVLEGDNVKSILFQVRRGKRYTYLCNGQECKNTQCIFFNNYMQTEMPFDLDSYKIEKKDVI